MRWHTAERPVYFHAGLEQARRDKTAFERNGLPVENLGGFVQDSIGWNDRIRRHRLFAHKKWGCAGLKWTTSLFIIWGSDCLTSSATSSSSVFLVMTMIIAATTFMITIYATSAFFILATTSAFRAVRIAFTLAAGTVLATTFYFHCFLFFFVLLCKQGHTAGWKNEDTSQYDFLHKL